MTDEPLFSPAEGSTPSSEAPDVAADPVDVAADEVMTRLRTQVRKAANEIERLRAENERLQQRVDALEARPAVGPDEAFLTLDADPKTAERQLQDFIDAIDAYLDANTPSP